MDFFLFKIVELNNVFMHSFLKVLPDDLAARQGFPVSSFSAGIESEKAKKKAGLSWVFRDDGQFKKTGHSNTFDEKAAKYKKDFKAA